jgi:hypothetical protein
MSCPSKACLTKNYSHSKLVLKWNNIAPTGIPSSAHLQSLPGMVQFLETYSDDDDHGDDGDGDDDDGDDDVFTCGLYITQDEKLCLFFFLSHCHS